MIAFLGAGVILGFSLGFSPGPLMALILSQTLQHGIKEGIKVAIAPLLTDLPIILLCLFVLTRVVHFRTILGIVSLFGGLFVLKLAYESIRTREIAFSIRNTEPQSIRKGALVNALNPNPYVFWLTAGTPTILKAWNEGLLTAVVFVAGFLGCLVAAKVTMAILAGKSRPFLKGKRFGYLIRVLGFFLLVFAVLLFRDGLKLLGFL
jgi:threonine/homoserine/homoserine lactone efflux protein